MKPGPEMTGNVRNLDVPDIAFLHPAIAPFERAARGFLRPANDPERRKTPQAAPPARHGAGGGRGSARKNAKMIYQIATQKG